MQSILILFYRESLAVNRRTYSSTNHSQRGEGRLKAILYTLFLVAGVFAAVKVVPAYVSNYQLKDKMDEQARFAVVNHYTQEQIRDILYKVVQDLDIPANREDIKVETNYHGIVISVQYSIPVDFIVYKTELNFTPSAEGRDIMK